MVSKNYKKPYEQAELTLISLQELDIVLASGGDVEKSWKSEWNDLLGNIFGD